MVLQWTESSQLLKKTCIFPKVAFYIIRFVGLYASVLFFFFFKFFASFFTIADFADTDRVQFCRPSWRVDAKFTWVRYSYL